MFSIVQAFLSIPRLLSVALTVALLAAGARSGRVAPAAGDRAGLRAEFEHVESAPRCAAEAAVGVSCSSCHLELLRRSDATCVEHPTPAAR